VLHQRQVLRARNVYGQDRINIAKCSILAFTYGVRMKKHQGPKVLIFDIETAPILAYVWKIFDENIGLNQIKSDWFVLSWSAKWLGESKVMYADQRNSKNLENDRPLLEAIWKLLDEADIVITQNGKRFDHKKLNARFVINGMQPPSSYKHIDTYQIAKKHFGFTSNKLEYMSDKLCTKYKKQTKRKFSGFELWKECLAGNKKAWQEMEKYNKYDTLALEELYTKLIPWDSTINFNLYSDEERTACTCGNTEFRNKGYIYTATGKFTRFKCLDCGAETRGRENLFSKEKRQSLKVSAPRS
jgi:uncharacterized protein YprB with RNaseH-like and TPR domain